MHIPLQITIHKDDMKVILKLEGTFDINARQVFQENYEQILSQHDVESLDIDLTEVNYLDSFALGMLLLLREKTELNGVKLALVNCRSQVRNIFETVFFHKLFTIN